MEEILASIRKIIADDQSKPAAAAAVEQVAPPVATVVAPPAPVAAAPVRPVPPPDDDILDLGFEATPLEVAGKAEVDPPSPPEAFEKAPLADVPPAMPEVELGTMMPVTAATDADMASLLSNQASHSISNAFGSLAHTVLSQNARTVDDLVREMLKPLLKGWLDDNLPTLVERLVRAEIERVARGGRG